MSELKFIEASEGKKPRVCGVAYSGGKMKVGWGDPVVVDLSGMQITENLPLLTNHCNNTSCRIGVISAAVQDNHLEINGEIVSDSEEAQQIVAQAKSGAGWQLSIGADVDESELVRDNRTINGMNHTGPFVHIKKCTLREVSVVAVGADASTIMKIAASFNLKGELMSEEKPVVAVASAAAESTVQASAAPVAETFKNEPTVDVSAVASTAAETAVKAERKRVSDIQSICSGEFADIEHEAISAGWDANQTREKVLEAFRKKQPATTVNISVPDKGNTVKALEASLALRAGLSADDLEKSYGAQVVEAGMKNMDLSLKELALECCRAEGITVGRSMDNETIRAAFSTVSLPEILNNVAHKKLQQAYAAQPIIATKLCRTGDLVDFKEAERLRLTDVGDLQPVAPDGEIKESGLTEEKAVNQLDTYGKKFCLTRKMIINDDLGAFMQVPIAMGNRAARLIDQLFFKRLLANPTQGDGSALFHANHRNLLTGTTSVLSKDSIQDAIGKFLDQVDADGQPISVEPKYLLVPTGLKFKATELIHGATLIMSGDTDTVRPAMNALVNENLSVISSPYLANTAYTGSSSTAWYLWGDPAQTDTFEIGFLKGKRTPTVERGETDYNTLGIWFRVYFDLGVREQGFRGMVKATGSN